MSDGRFITLDKLTRDVCVANGDTDFSTYARVMRSAGLAVDEIFRGLPVIQSKLFEIKDNLTVTLPGDAIQVTKVAILNGEGELYSLFENTNLRRQLQNQKDTQDENCGDDEVAPAATVAEALAAGLYNYLPFYNYFDGTGGCMDHIYGYTFDPAVLIGTYRYDQQNGVVEFGSGPHIESGATCVIEYKSNGSEQYLMIPAEAQQTLMALANYNLNQGLRPQVAELQKRQADREYQRLKRFYLRRPPEFYVRAITKHYSPTPR